MDTKHLVCAIAADYDTQTASDNEQEQIEALLEEIKQKQIILNQHKLILSAVKEAASDATLEESARGIVNRVLVHHAFVKNGSLKDFFSESVIKTNIIAKLSYSESTPLREIVEKVLTKKSKELTDKLNATKKGPSTKFNAENEKVNVILECALEMKRAQDLHRQEQELFSSLAALRLKSLEDMHNSAHNLVEKNMLLALKSKVEALSFKHDMLLKEDRDLPQAVSKLAAFWHSESKKVEAAVQKAEQDVENYARLEENTTYKKLLAEYRRILDQNKCLRTALGKF